ATSKIAPFSTLTSLPWACGAFWKCRPRTVPLRALKAWLSCTKRVSTPAAASAFWLQVSANQPRASPCRLGVISRTSARARGVIVVISARACGSDPSDGAARRDWQAPGAQDGAGGQRRGGGLREWPDPRRVPREPPRPDLSRLRGPAGGQR